MVNVGIIGFGIVGSGTAKILVENGDLLKERLGFAVQLRRIADLDIVRDRGIQILRCFLLDRGLSMRWDIPTRV